MTTLPLILTVVIVAIIVAGIVWSRARSRDGD
jgi:hypothetical protein